MRAVAFLSIMIFIYLAGCVVERAIPDFDEYFHYAEIVRIKNGFYKNCIGEVTYHPEPNVYSVFLHYCDNKKKPVSIEREFKSEELEYGP